MELCRILTFKQFCWLRWVMRGIREEQNRMIENALHEAHLKALEPEKRSWWKLW